MSHIAIYIDQIRTESGNLRLDGHAVLNDAESSQISWNTAISFTALSSTINAAVRDAAVDAAAVAGYTVGALDKKTLFTGAVGL